MSDQKFDNSDRGDIILYQTEDDRTRIECRPKDETMWLSQAQMVELFSVEVNTINYHLKEVYSSGELQREATIRNFRIVRTERNRNVTREIDALLKEVAVLHQKIS